MNSGARKRNSATWRVFTVWTAILTFAAFLSACSPPTAGVPAPPSALPTTAPVSASGVLPTAAELPQNPMPSAKATVASPTQITTRAAPLATRPNVPKLNLVVSAPQDESIVATSSITVTGQTSAGAVVSVNGDLITVDANGRFRAAVTLDEGPNAIEVNASDVNGNELGTVLTVIYEP